MRRNAVSEASILLILRQHPRKMGGQQGGTHATEMKLLAPGENGGGNCVDLGGRENEDKMRRWLFDDLEQGIEGLTGESMNLVDDHHLVAVAGGAVFEALCELSYLFDLGIGGGIHLDHIEIGSGRDLGAGSAVVARVCGGPVLAIERLGQNPRDTGLADTPNAREQIGLRDSSFLESVAQCRYSGFLADDAGEILRAPLACEYLVGHI